MLNFKKIDFSSLELIKSHLEKSEYSTCDYTVLGIYMWIDYFGYEYALSDDALYIRSTKNGVKYLMPVTHKDLTVAIENIKELERSRGESEVYFDVVPENYLLSFSGQSVIKTELLLDWSDYTYPAENLAFLSGKKFSKKRNLIHQFKGEYPNYTFSPISKDNLDKVKAFNQKINFSDLCEAAFYEHQKTLEVLDNFFRLGVFGDVIEVDDKVVAFAIGEIKGDTLFVHIEKADKEYKGAYQMINATFAEKYFLQGVREVNREDDMGNEGLKKAKSSYYPNMLNKYAVTINSDIL